MCFNCDIIQKELAGKNITAISIEGEANQICYIKTSEGSRKNSTFRVSLDSKKH